MRAGVLAGATVPLGAPKNWDPERDGPCDVLHVRVDHEQAGTFMTSAWVAEPDEIGWLLAGGHVQLGVSAPSHPVVRMGVTAPPPESPPVYTITQAVQMTGKPAVRVTMYAPRQGLTRRGGTVWCEIEIQDGNLPAATAEAMRLIQRKAAELGQL